MEHNDSSDNISGKIVFLYLWCEVSEVCCSDFDKSILFFFKQRSSRISQKIQRPVTGRPFLRLKNPGASGGQPLLGGNSWRKLEN